MNRKDFDIHWSRARGHGFACTSSLQSFPYPFRSITGRGIYLAVARTYTLSDSRGTFNVVLAMRQRTSVDEKDIEIWCSDQFLEGKLTSDQELERCTCAVSGIPDSEELVVRMQQYAGGLNPSSPCDFWKLKRSKPPQLCVHAQHALTMVKPADLREMEDLLNSWRTGQSGGPTTAPGKSVLDQYLFRVPVLMEGDRGSGKTHESRDFAERHSLPLIELAGHEGVEAVDMLGTYVPVGDRSLIWKDGPITQAFRRGSKGQKVVLLLDELLRIPQRQLSVLLTALSPYKGMCTLRTGRIVNVEDGIGEEEVLICPVENLAVVGTTNVGAHYALDELDPAIAERFLPMRKDSTEASVRAALLPTLAAKGFPARLADELVRFFTKSRELCKAGQFARAPTTRTLVRAVELAPSDREVGTMLLNQALLWVDRDLDGLPVEEQIDSVRKVVKSIFPTAVGKVLL